jgi:hypothetical protein
MTPEEFEALKLEIAGQRAKGIFAIRLVLAFDACLFVACVGMVACRLLARWK